MIGCVYQLPLMLQSQQHNIRVGVCVQNDVMADKVLAQVRQTRLLCQLLNSVGS